jgi:hypothetical protein
MNPPTSDSAGPWKILETIRSSIPAHRPQALAELAGNLAAGYLSASWVLSWVPALPVPSTHWPGASWAAIPGAQLQPAAVSRRPWAPSPSRCHGSLLA